MDEIAVQLENTLERTGKPLAITRDEDQWASLLTLEHIFWPPRMELNWARTDPVNQTQSSGAPVTPHGSRCRAAFSPAEGCGAITCQGIFHSPVRREDMR